MAMEQIVSLPLDLIDIPNIPPTAGITGARSGTCSNEDVVQRTEVVVRKIKAREPINEFNRMWSTVAARTLVREGYRPSPDDGNVWVWNGTTTRSFAEPLPDGRFIVDPQALTWNDVLRFNQALGDDDELDDGSRDFVTRCLRVLRDMSADREVLSYREALKCMLKGNP
jgi:hypothetical protein